MLWVDRCKTPGCEEMALVNFGYYCKACHTKTVAEQHAKIREHMRRGNGQAMSTVDKACEFLDQVKELLKSKNASYGDSAGSPLRIFSKSDATAGIRVRIDDKLSRVARGTQGYQEDTVKDLVGYLALLQAMEGDKHG